MKFIVALFIAAVSADAANKEEAEMVTPMLGQQIATATDAPTLQFAGDGTTFTWSGVGQKENTWFGIAWGGTGTDDLTKADFLRISTADNKVTVTDMWSESSGAWAAQAPKEDANSVAAAWTKTDAKTTQDADTKAWTWEITGANPMAAADANDIAVPCGTKAEGDVAATMNAFQIEWFYSPVADFATKYTETGDIHVETDGDCKVVWWALEERPEVMAGAQALAAATTAVIAALYM